MHSRVIRFFTRVIRFLYRVIRFSYTVIRFFYRVVRSQRPKVNKKQVINEESNYRRIFQIPGSAGARYLKYSTVIRVLIYYLLFIHFRPLGSNYPVKKSKHCILLIGVYIVRVLVLSEIFHGN